MPGYYDVGGYTVECPNFTHPDAPIDWLEDEIARRGLWAEYIKALVAILPDHGDGGWRAYPDATVWEIIRATPEQRARAFLATVSPA